MPAPTSGPCSFISQGSTTPTTISNCQQLVSSSTLVTFENGYVFADTGTVLVIVLTAVVAGVIALLGLGFGIRHVRRWITGRKF